MEAKQHEDIMFKLKYKSWSEVPISLYYDISSITDMEDLEPVDKNVKLISLLSDTPEDDIWSLSMNEAESVFSQLGWLWSFSFPKNNPGKKMKIGDKTFTLSTDLQEFTISQYIDFQNLWHEFKDNKESALPQLLAVFLVPEGRKYNTDYKTSDIAQFFLTRMPITTANQILYFFLLSLARSIRATEICYGLMMKILRKRTKTKEEKEKIKNLEKETLKMINQAQHILGSLL